MGNDKPTDIFSLSLSFFLFSIFQNFKSHRPIFDEPAKSAPTNFVSFSENRLVFNYIVIHALHNYSSHGNEK
jgi:hypothetical protein